MAGAEWAVFQFRADQPAIRGIAANRLLEEAQHGVLIGGGHDAVILCGCGDRCNSCQVGAACVRGVVGGLSTRAAKRFSWLGKRL